MMRRCISLMDQFFSTSVAARKSSNSGWVGLLPVLPKLSKLIQEITTTISSTTGAPCFWKNRATAVLCRSSVVRMKSSLEISIVSSSGFHAVSTSRSAHSRGVTPFATALLLMTAYASSVGGIATPIGTATNLVAKSFFERPEYFNQKPDFGRWVMVGAPMMVVLFVGLFLWLKMRAPAHDLDLNALRTYLQRERAKLGPWKIGEKNTLAVFLFVVAMWVTPAPLALFADVETAKAFSRRFPEEIVALLVPILLFFLPVDWKNRKATLAPSDWRELDWGTTLLFGAGLSLGNLMLHTGLAEAIANTANDALRPQSVWEVTALAIFGGIFLSEFTSNAATATTLIPIVFGICTKADLDPVLPLLGVTFGASFGSALPVSTPPNAIVYGSGLVPARRMIVAGIGMDVISAIAIWLVLRLAGQLGWTPFIE